MMNTSKLSKEQITTLLETLQHRFENNMHRHSEHKWQDIQKKLTGNSDKLWSLFQMEETGGEPDVIGFDEHTKEYLICDCTAESPKGRRSVCYDQKALESRKTHKPKNSAMTMAKDMGIELLNEEEYKNLQRLERFDTKTSSWLLTPSEVRELGGAIFGDWRFGRTFIYHNGAESYYAARGFRGLLRI